MIEKLLSEGYKLTWSEEFDKGKLDLSTWTHEIGYIRNNELQDYTNREENIRIENNMLIIEGRNDGYGRTGYSSASIYSQGKFNWLFGCIEMRAKLPYGKGMWPAFWMMGEEGHWPACGETDILELVGGSDMSKRENDSTVFPCLHWRGADGKHAAKGGEGFVLPDGEKYADAFHTFAYKWTPESAEWYVDGKMYCEIDISGAQFDAFRKPNYILLNLAIGGDWPGSPDETTIVPQQYIIDYLRIYQK